MHVQNGYPFKIFRMKSGVIAMLQMMFERDTAWHSLKIALIVGTILTLINHMGDLMSRHITAPLLFSILLTYCVPYVVAATGVIHGKAQLRNLQRNS